MLGETQYLFSASNRITHLLISYKLQQNISEFQTHHDNIALHRVKSEISHKVKWLAVAEITEGYFPTKMFCHKQTQHTVPSRHFCFE